MCYRRAPAAAQPAGRYCGSCQVVLIRHIWFVAIKWWCQKESKGGSWTNKTKDKVHSEAKLIFFFPLYISTPFYLNFPFWPLLYLHLFSIYIPFLNKSYWFYFQELTIAISLFEWSTLTIVFEMAHLLSEFSWVLLCPNNSMQGIVTRVWIPVSSLVVKLKYFMLYTLCGL